MAVFLIAKATSVRLSVTSVNCDKTKEMTHCRHILWSTQFE